MKRLIARARRAFGEHLTMFLLSGWGEQEDLGCRSFIVSQQSCGAESEFRIEVISDDLNGLPRSQHPLVLLALLRLWLDRGLTPLGQLVYGHDEVFDLLGWESSDRARAVTDEAVRRYHNLIYESVYDCSGLTISSRQRLLSGYRASDETVDGPAIVRRVYREL